MIFNKYLNLKILFKYNLKLFLYISFFNYISINKLHPDVNKIMRLLRLRQIHNATLVRVNTAT